MKKNNRAIIILCGSIIGSMILFFGHVNAYAIDEEQLLSKYMWSKAANLSSSDRPKIALVLGGGGGRGLAHIGVIKVLEEEQIPIDIVVGTSVGALVGSLYSAGVPITKIEKIGSDIKWNKISNLGATSLIKLILSEKLLSTKRMESYLKKMIDDKQFYELDRKFACVTTDITTGERIVMREGDVALATRASATIPGVFEPVVYRHRFLVDGGISSNIPTDIAKMLGADIIIAVSVDADITKNSFSNVLHILTQSMYIQGSHLDKEKLLLADVVIRPEVGEVSTIDLDKSPECIDAGILAARKKVNDIKDIIMKKTRPEEFFK